MKSYLHPILIFCAANVVGILIIYASGQLAVSGSVSLVISAVLIGSFFLLTALYRNSRTEPLSLASGFKIFALIAVLGIFSGGATKYILLQADSSLITQLKEKAAANQEANLKGTKATGLISDAQSERMVQQSIEAVNSSSYPLMMIFASMLFSVPLGISGALFMAALLRTPT